MSDREIAKSFALTEFASELRRLADALESGEGFSIDIDGETIEVPADAVVSVEFEQEEDGAELEFQLSWELSDEDDGEEDDEDEEEDEETEAA